MLDGVFVSFGFLIKFYVLYCGMGVWCVVSGVIEGSFCFNKNLKIDIDRVEGIVVFKVI